MGHSEDAVVGISLFLSISVFKSCQLKNQKIPNQGGRAKWGGKGAKGQAPCGISRSWQAVLGVDGKEANRPREGEKGKGVREWGVGGII